MTLLINSKWKLKRDGWVGSDHCAKGTLFKIVQISISEFNSYVTLSNQNGKQVQMNVEDLMTKYKGV